MNNDYDDPSNFMEVNPDHSLAYGDSQRNFLGFTSVMFLQLLLSFFFFPKNPKLINII